MSDFVSGFWNMYVVVIVLGSILACAVLLYMQGKAKFTPGKTMGHVWDETLEEYNNPMPKWWSWLFVITVIFALVYLALYPGLGKFPGLLGWTSVGQYKIERERMDATVQPMYAKYQGMDVKALAADKQAMETGKRLYLTYCMQCHGADGRGAKGFPNLADSDWLYGGEPEQIKQTIADRPHGRHAAARTARCGYHQGSGELCPLALRSAERLGSCRQGQGSLHLRGLRRLSWHGRQGDAGDWRPQPDRQGLAVRLLGSYHHRDDHQRSPEQDAGLEGIPGRRQGSIF